MRVSRNGEVGSESGREKKRGSGKKGWGRGRGQRKWEGREGVEEGGRGRGGGVKRKEKEGQGREEGGPREEKGRYKRGKEERRAWTERSEERWLGGRGKGWGRGGGEELQREEREGVRTPQRRKMQLRCLTGHPQGTRFCGS